jgi:hypothetical protein
MGAMALLAVIARANLADAYDERGRLLPVPLWRLTLQLAVKSVKGCSIILHDGLKACWLIARAAGRLSPAPSRISSLRPRRLSVRTRESRTRLIARACATGCHQATCAGLRNSTIAALDT